MTDEERSAQQGRVIQPGRGPRTGYVSGLPFIEEQIPLFKKSDGRAYWFCRDVGIAKINPGSEQTHVVNEGRELVEKGELTQSQLDYIYQQFEFDPLSYQPPAWTTRKRNT